MSLAIMENSKTKRYEDGKARALQHSLRTSAQVRDIGPPPPPENPERRAAAFDDLGAFLLTYFPQSFPLEFSADHLDVISTLQRVATSGGLYALAMPRGSGKTTITIRAALWAILTGRRKFVSIVSATDGAAKKCIRALKTELTHNRTLYADFAPEIHGIPQLQGDNRKAGGQLCEGEKTSVVLGQTEIVFPTIPGSPISGCVISGCGLTGNIRGQVFTSQSGDTIRPDFAILDDPQTKESARSAAQTQERLEIVMGDVLGLAGPGSTIAAVMPCTVIEEGDLADRTLKQPLWNGKRTKTLYAFPSDLKVWDTYFEIRSEAMRVEKTVEPGNEFYRQHREKMDAGAIVAWPQRHGPDEVSAIQAAMNLWFRSPGAFAAEYQNEPLVPGAGEDRPTLAKLTEKLTRLPRRTVPVWATKLTVGVDVQQRLLFYVVAAWGEGLTGSIIDYGTMPEQPRAYYTLSDANPTLQSESGSRQLEGALYWGLERLGERVLGATWQREGGGGVRIDKCLVDANWGPSTDLIYEFCRRSPYGGIIHPAHGKGIKAGDKEMAEWPKKQGEEHGWHWILTPGAKQRLIRHVVHDTNHWKTFIADRCGALPGDKGSLSLFGEKPEPHRLLMDHLAAESCEKTMGRGRELWEWRLRADGGDNHFLDALCGAAIAASMCKLSLSELKPPVEVRKATTSADYEAKRREFERKRGY